MRSPIRDLRDAVASAFGDDVGGAELAGELLAGLVAAHRDGLFGAELPDGQDREQARDQVVSRGSWGGDEGALGWRDAGTAPGLRSRRRAQKHR